jgi:cation:H+ antiporter
MYVIGLIAGLIGLWIGTELTLRGAVAIANRFGLSEFIVGVAVLSIGSDLPELTIAIQGAISNLQDRQVSDVIVGSALGSALCQLGFVLGLSGLLGYLTLPKQAVYRHGSILLGSVVLLGLFGLDGVISRAEGAALVTVYAIYFVFLLTETRNAKPAETDSTLSIARTCLYLIAGLGVVIASAALTVSSASQAARALNIEEAFIAVVIIGLGTSLPELSISLGAILKRHGRMSVGNIIGSNIFDTLMPVGVAGLISGLQLNRTMLTVEIPFLFFLSALVLVFLVKKKGIQKPEAISMIGLYFGFVLLKL